MNVRFSNLAMLAVLASGLGFAWGQTEKSVQSSPPAQQLVQAAARRVAGYETIEAKLRLRTELIGEPLVGSGAYAHLKATSGLLLRLELAIQAGGQASSVKQICNGPDLWEHWQWGGKDWLHHVDLRRVERGLSRNPEGRELGISTSNLALGGLPKVLSQLDQTFDFSKSPPRPGKISDVEIWTVTGVWKQDQLARVAPEAVEAGKIIFDKLPGHLPHQVEIQLGRHDLFPYRIIYQRWSASEGSNGATIVPAVTTEFYEVALNASLDPTQFNFQQPNNGRVADRTDVFLKSLGIAMKPASTQR